MTKVKITIVFFWWKIPGEENNVKNGLSIVVCFSENQVGGIVILQIKKCDL
jgi:hypothetical protein